MRHTTSSLQSFVAAKRFRAPGEAIEWEDLPSLADSLAARLVNDPQRRRQLSQFDGYSGNAWDNTMPADLLSITPPAQPFCETLNGLATREVHEPDVFRHFFGSTVA